MASVEIDPTIQVFYQAQAAHESVGHVKRLIASYQRSSKALTAENFQPMLVDLREAKAELDKAIEAWESILSTIGGNPSMQA